MTLGQEELKHEEGLQQRHCSTPAPRGCGELRIREESENDERALRGRPKTRLWWRLSRETREGERLLLRGAWSPLRAPPSSNQGGFEKRAREVNSVQGCLVFKGRAVLARWCRSPGGSG
jgi:hypothetical protein